MEIYLRTEGVAPLKLLPYIGHTRKFAPAATLWEFLRFSATQPS